MYSFYQRYAGILVCLYDKVNIYAQLEATARI